MISKIGNLYKDDFEMECILCGRGEALATIAHRTNKRIVGFVIACRDCREKIYGAGFQLWLIKKEESNGN